MGISEITKKISPVLAKYSVKRAAVFGSVSRGDENPDSDVDLLIKLGNEPMGMFKYMSFVEEVENSLGRKVDMVTEGSEKFLRPYILRDIKTIYEG